MPGRGAMNEPTTDALLHNVDFAHVAPSRRGVFAAIAGGLFAHRLFGLDVAGVEAKGGGKGRKRKNRNKRKRKERGPETRADATCPGPRDNALFVNGGSRLAQTLTATQSGPLVRAELVIHKEAGSSGDYLLSLSPVDNSGVPTNDVLAVALVADASVPNGDSTVDFTFPDPAVVEVGAQLALVFTRLNGGTLGWTFRTGDFCAGRGFFSIPASTSFQVRPDDDFLFTTFVRS